MVQMKSALGGTPVGRAMVTDFHTLDAGDSLSRAVDLVRNSSQVVLPGWFATASLRVC